MFYHLTVIIITDHVEGNIGGYFPHREGAMQISTTFTDITGWIILIIIIIHLCLWRRWIFPSPGNILVYYIGTEIYTPKWIVKYKWSVAEYTQSDWSYDFSHWWKKYCITNHELLTKVFTSDKERIGFPFATCCEVCVDFTSAIDSCHYFVKSHYIII